MMWELAVSALDLVFDRENILDGNMEYFRYVPRQHQRGIVSALFQVPDGFSANAHELCQFFLLHGVFGAIFPNPIPDHFPDPIFL